MSHDKSCFIQMKMATNRSTGRYTVSQVLQLLDTNQTDLDKTAHPTKKAHMKMIQMQLLAAPKKKKNNNNGGGTMKKKKQTVR